MSPRRKSPRKLSLRRKRSLMRYLPGAVLRRRSPQYIARELRRLDREHPRRRKLRGGVLNYNQNFDNNNPNLLGQVLNGNDQFGNPFRIENEFDDEVHVINVYFREVNDFQDGINLNIVQQAANAFNNQHGTELDTFTVRHPQWNAVGIHVDGFLNNDQQIEFRNILFNLLNH